MENKTGKYIKYAIGEIVLVVIGILIALQINNWNENRSNKLKVNNLLGKVKKEIETDLTEINNLITFFYFKDSINQLIRNKKLNALDYRSPSAGTLITSIITYNGLNLKRNGYDNLMKVQDIIPDSYEPIIDKLSILYNNHYSTVKEMDARLMDLVINNVEYLHENFSWFSSMGIGLSDDQIEFLVKSPKYQSMVALYQGMSTSNLVPASIRYLQSAKDAYEDISVILEGSNSSVTTLKQIQVDRANLGLYKDIAGDSIRFEIRNNRPYIIDSDGFIECHQFATDKIFYPLSNLFMRFQTKADSTNIYLSVFENGSKPYATKIENSND